MGPNAQSVIYSIYGSQDATVLAMKKGDIHFMLNPLGLSKGLQEQLQGERGLTTVEDPDSGIRYLGFNFRRPPPAISGEVAAPIDPLPRCRFFDRCPAATSFCEHNPHPPMEERGPGRFAACYEV